MRFQLFTAFFVLSGLTAGGFFFLDASTVIPASIWVFAGATVLALAVMTLWSNACILNPLRAISTQMSRLRSGQDFNLLDVSGSSKEVREIQSFFNDTIGAFKEAEDNLNDQRRLSEELAVARRVQKQLLPKSTANIPGLDVVIKTRNASEVGGDNFDILSGDNSTLLYVGDATGHGTAAGLVMSMVNVLVHGFSHLSDRPADMLSNINRVLQPKLTTSMFMTLAMLRWHHDSNTLHLTGCGHEHVLVYRAATGTVERIKSGGIALGMTPDVSRIIKEQSIPFEENDTALLFTDGIPEARDSAGAMLGLDALEAVFARSGGLGNAKSIFEAMSHELKEKFSSDHLTDDITLAVVKRQKTKPASGLSVRNPCVAQTAAAWDWE